MGNGGSGGIERDPGENRLERRGWDRLRADSRAVDELVRDQTGQATTEAILLMAAVVMPMSAVAIWWMYIIARWMFPVNAKLLALPFP